MRKLLLVASIIALFALSVQVIKAHPGRTDSNGGHIDHDTGEYHYHHGYSAHDHYDMDGDGDLDCPYNFDDKTNHGSGGNSNTTDKVHEPTTETTADKRTESGKANKFRHEVVIKIVAAIVVVGLWISPIFFNNKKRT